MTTVILLLYSYCLKYYTRFRILWSWPINQSTNSSCHISYFNQSIKTVSNYLAVNLYFNKLPILVNPVIEKKSLLRRLYYQFLYICMHFVSSLNASSSFLFLGRFELCAEFCATLADKHFCQTTFFSGFENVD